MAIIEGSAVQWGETSGSEPHGVVRILGRVMSELRECVLDNRSATTVEYGIVFFLSVLVIWIIAPLRCFNGLGAYSSVLISHCSTFLDPTSPTVIIDRAEVLRRSGLKKSTMYNLIRRGEFPAQIKLTDGTVGWDSAEVEVWIQNRKALRNRFDGKKVTLPLAGNEVPVMVEQYAGSAQPNGKPNTGCQAAILTESQLKQLTGQELSEMRSSDARPFYDKLSGRLWICVLQTQVPRP